MKIKKSIMLLFLSILLCGVLTSCSTTEEVTEESSSNIVSVETIKEKGTLIVGTSAEYPPFEFHTMIDGKDTIVGLDILLAEYIADNLGVELEIKDMDFNNLLGGMSTGMVDIVIAGMNPDPSREEQARFTDIYYEANLSVLLNKDSNLEISNLSDLEGKSIGVQIGTTQEDIAKDIKESDVKSLSKNPDIVMNLKTNKIDCAIMETPVANSFAAVNDDIIVADNFTIDIDSGGIAIATKRDNEELVLKLNEIISEVKSKGLIDDWLIEAQELSDKSL